MTSQLLKKYVKQVLLQEQTSKVKYLLQYLKDADADEVYENLEDSFPLIGEGSSRIVFKIDDDRVIKLAKNTAGISQNKAEANPAIQSAYGDIITKIYDRHPDYLWIEMEMAIDAGFLPNGEDSVMEAAGITGYNISWDDIMDYLSVMTSNFESNEEFEIDWHYPTPQIASNAFIEKLVKFMIEFKVRAGDIGGANIGLTVGDGRPVVLDYGFNDDVYYGHYNSGNMEPLSFVKKIQKELEANKQVFETYLKSKLEDDFYFPDQARMYVGNDTEDVLDKQLTTYSMRITDLESGLTPRGTSFQFTFKPYTKVPGMKWEIEDMQKHRGDSIKEAIQEGIEFWSAGWQNSTSATYYKATYEKFKELFSK